MLPSFSLSGVALLAWAVSVTAAPTVAYLYPAGAARGTTTEVTASGTFDVWPANVWVSGKGVRATAAKTKGILNVVVDRDAEPGVYWLRCHDAQGGGNLRPFVVGTLPEIAEKEPNDEPKQPHKLDATALVVNGKLQKNGDVDCFALALKKGQSLVASMTANQTLQSPMDAVVQVVSADGFVLDQNHDFRGLDPQVVYDVPKDGTYLVRVFAFPSVPDSGIRYAGGDNFVYRLTLTTGGFVDHALPLAVPQTNPGSVTLTGWNIPADVAKVAVKADISSLFHPQWANVARVRLEPHACYDAIAKEPGTLQPPLTVTGRIVKPRGANTFTITAKKGQALLVEVESATLGFPLVPVVRILDAAGKQVGRAEPAQLHRDASLTFNPPADGEYRVEVRDQHTDGGPRHVYRLRVVRPEPDFTLKLPADRFVVPSDKPLTLTPVLGRLNGFNKEVTLTVENLPPGVTAKIDKLNVTLTAEKPGVSGTFRLVGQSGDVKRLATVDLADVSTTTSDLWLTTTPKK